MREERQLSLPSRGQRRSAASPSSAARSAARSAAQRASRLQARKDASRAAFAMDLVALATGVPSEDISSDTRNHARAARARQIAMYLTYVAWQWPLARIGSAFGRDRTTAGYACRLVEDLREDRQFDSRLERLEACLRAAPEPEDVTLLSPDLSEMAGV